MLTLHRLAQQQHWRQRSIQKHAVLPIVSIFKVIVATMSTTASCDEETATATATATAAQWLASSRQQIARAILLDDPSGVGETVITTVSNPVVASIVREGFAKKDYHTVSLLLDEARSIGKLSVQPLEQEIDYLMQMTQFEQAFLLFNICRIDGLRLKESICAELLAHFSSNKFHTESFLIAEYIIKHGYSFRTRDFKYLLNGLTKTPNRIGDAFQLMHILIEHRRDDILTHIDFSWMERWSLFMASSNDAVKYEAHVTAAHMEAIVSAVMASMHSFGWYSLPLLKWIVSMGCIINHVDYSIDLLKQAVKYFKDNPRGQPQQHLLLQQQQQQQQQQASLSLSSSSVQDPVDDVMQHSVLGLLYTLSYAGQVARGGEFEAKNATFNGNNNNNNNNNNASAKRENVSAIDERVGESGKVVFESVRRTPFENANVLLEALLSECLVCMKDTHLLSQRNYLGSLLSLHWSLSHKLQIADVALVSPDIATEKLFDKLSSFYHDQNKKEITFALPLAGTAASAATKAKGTPSERMMLKVMSDLFSLSHTSVPNNNEFDYGDVLVIQKPLYAHQQRQRRRFNDQEEEMDEEDDEELLPLTFASLEDLLTRDAARGPLRLIDAAPPHWNTIRQLLRSAASATSTPTTSMTNTPSSTTSSTTTSSSSMVVAALTTERTRQAIDQVLRVSYSSPSPSWCLHYVELLMELNIPFPNQLVAHILIHCKRRNDPYGVIETMRLLSHPLAKSVMVPSYIQEATTTTTTTTGSEGGKMSPFSIAQAFHLPPGIEIFSDGATSATSFSTTTQQQWASAASIIWRENTHMHRKSFRNTFTDLIRLMKKHTVTMNRDFVEMFLRFLVKHYPYAAVTSDLITHIYRQNKTHNNNKNNSSSNNKNNTSSSAAASNSSGSNNSVGAYAVGHSECVALVLLIVHFTRLGNARKAYSHRSYHSHPPFRLSESAYNATNNRSVDGDFFRVHPAALHRFATEFFATANSDTFGRAFVQEMRQQWDLQNTTAGRIRMYELCYEWVTNTKTNRPKICNMMEPPQRSLLVEMCLYVVHLLCSRDRDFVTAFALLFQLFQMVKDVNLLHVDVDRKQLNKWTMQQQQQIHYAREQTVKRNEAARLKLQQQRQQEGVPLTQQQNVQAVHEEFYDTIVQVGDNNNNNNENKQDTTTPLDDEVWDWSKGSH